MIDYRVSGGPSMPRSGKCTRTGEGWARLRVDVECTFLSCHATFLICHATSSSFCHSEERTPLNADCDAESDHSGLIYYLHNSTTTSRTQASPVRHRPSRGLRQREAGTRRI
eukprot:2341941-Rhodomonas_salina.2